MERLAADLLENLFYEKNSVFQLDMQEYLRKHDVIFESPQIGGFEGLPIGNGDMAAMVWTDERRVNLQINKSDLWTQPIKGDPMLLRSAAKVSLDFCCPAFSQIHLEQFCMRLVPAEGIVKLSAATPFSKVEMEMKMLRGANCIYMKLSAQGCGRIRLSLERYGSRGFPFWYHAIESEPQNGIGRAKAKAEEKRIAITESFFSAEDRAVCTSVITSAEHVHTAVIHERRAEMEITENDSELELLLCCASGNESEEAEENCGETETCCTKDLHYFLKQTDNYWRDYWNSSRVILDQEDPQWDYIENLYIIQRYMMACGCSSQYPMTFNGGTFTWNEDIRQWGNPHHWNTHMVYNATPDYLNRPEMMEGYINAYLRMMPQAKEFSKAKGAPDGILISEMHDFSGRMLAYPGALTPASHIALIFWDHFRFENDKQFLRERAYPFMKAAAEFYLQYAKEENGIYHIFPAGVYECEFGEDFVDTTPDLCAVRALFPACVEASEILGIDGEKRKEWKDFLDKLAPFTFVKNEKGEEILAVGRDKDKNAADFGEQNMTFMRNCANVYPWNITGIGNRGERLYQAALHAISDYRPTAVAISPTPVVYARLGIGGAEIREILVQTIRQLQHFPQGLYYNIDHWCKYSRYFTGEKDFITTQRDYIYDERCRYIDIDAGNRKTGLSTRPFVQCGFETPAILMMAIHESALQSQEDIIRVFPIRDLFGNCGFTLKARGGFLISAVQREGRFIPAVLVKSLCGNRCRLDVSGFGKEVFLYADGVLSSMEGEVSEFDTCPGKEYLVFSPCGDMLQKVNFARCTGENRCYKSLYEARIGSERLF